MVTVTRVLRSLIPRSYCGVAERRQTSPNVSRHRPGPASCARCRCSPVLGGELKGDVDDHVFLAADVAGLADTLQDLVGGDAVAGGGALGVQQEAVVDPGVALGDG